MATFDVYIEEEHEGKTYTTRRIMQVTERTIDKHGQALWIPASLPVKPQAGSAGKGEMAIRGLWNQDLLRF